MIVCLIIFLLTVIGYCSGIWSLATVSIISMVALTVTGCISPSEALTYFGNNNVVMIAGMCVVAAGFNKTKFCRLMAEKISSLAKGNLVKVMFGYVIIGVLLSQFIQSPLVVFGIVAPMLAASAKAMGINNSKIMFALGVSTIITCCTLPLGAGATVAAELNGYLESYGYTEHMVGLLDPAIGRIPLLIIVVIFCAVVLPKISPDKPVVETKTIREENREQKVELAQFAQIAGLVIFVADALALMFAKQIHMENWQITVIGALLMIVFGVLKPVEATRSIPWSMLLLIVGSLAISGALSSTGAGELIGNHMAKIVAAFNGNSYLVGSIFFIVPFILTQVMSNRGAMLIFHPIAIATCASIGGNPVGLMIIIQAACLSAFMTPMATGAVPFIMDYGGYDQVSMIKQSWLLSLICFVVSVGWIMTIFPIL